MLSVDGITKRYRSVQALDSVSFDVQPGQIVGFLGPNGAGKTTTMRAIMGLITLEAGTATWNGATIDDSVRNRVGYLPAERGMYPKMRVRDHLEYYTRLSGLDRSATVEAVDKWIEVLGLGEHASKDVQALSSGNQQRVQLAMALTCAPDLLLLDEPFSGLDPVAVAVLSETLRAEADRGAAVLLSSHQLDLVSALCSSVVVVDHGRVVLSGPVTRLRSASPTRVLSIGFSQATDWSPPAVDAHRAAPDRYEIHLGDDADSTALIADARRVGEVIEFSYRPPELSEIFLDALTPGASR